VRGFIDGVALHLAKPHGDLAYFRSAKLALRSCTAPASAITICQGAELAPWQRRPGLCDRFSTCALLQDAQPLFRIAAYEDCGIC
jgi:hypothetical protein